MPTGAVRIILIGAGQRGGDVYGQYPLECSDLDVDVEVVAIVDPRPQRRRQVAKRHGLLSSSTPQEENENRLFSSIPPTHHPIWRHANAAIIASPDRSHCEDTLHVLSCGISYILLEKPMATNWQDCQRIVTASRSHKACIAVCHVLRYTPFNRAITQVLQGGRLGEILHVDHTEPVGYAHFCHSFVRGNWAIEEKSSCALLAKCCHDVDLLHAWMQQASASRDADLTDDEQGHDNKSTSSLEKKVENAPKLLLPQSLVSMGNLQHFTKNRKPQSAKRATRCLVDCPYEAQCPYSAKKVYMDPFDKKLQQHKQEEDDNQSFPSFLNVVLATAQEEVKNDGTQEPQKQIKEEIDQTQSATKLLHQALLTGPYGRCAYECSNDVCDHQTLTMHYPQGTTVHLTMVATTERLCTRQTKIYGSRGEMVADAGGGPNRQGWIRVFDFVSGESKVLEPSPTAVEEEDARDGLEPRQQRAVPKSLSGHGCADYHLMSNFCRAVATDDPSLVLTSVEESLWSHLLVFLAEKSRLQGRVVRLENEDKDGDDGGNENAEKGGEQVKLPRMKGLDW